MYAHKSFKNYTCLKYLYESAFAVLTNGSHLNGLKPLSFLCLTVLHLSVWVGLRQMSLLGSAGLSHVSAAPFFLERPEPPNMPLAAGVIPNKRIGDHFREGCELH